MLALAAQAKQTFEMMVQSPAQVEDYIIFVAQKEGVSVSVATNIARCESEFNVFAKNIHSSAESTFQFIDSTWEQTMTDMGYPTTTSKFSPRLSVEAGVFLLKRDGVVHWEASRNCWGVV